MKTVTGRPKNRDVLAPPADLTVTESVTSLFYHIPSASDWRQKHAA